MKTQLACLLLCLLLVTCSKDTEITDGPNSGYVSKTVVTKGGSKNDSAQSVVKTSDGGYAILGFTQSSDGDVSHKQNDSYDYWVLKYASNHTLQWSKTYGGSGDDRGEHIIETQDGGFAILGYSTSNDGDVSLNAGAQDYWLAKLDNLGNLLWQKSYGYIGADLGKSVMQTPDGGYFITGVLDVTASGGAGNTKQANQRHAGGDYWVLKLDNQGTIEWSKYYGGSFTDTPYDAVKLADGGYILIGSSDSDDVDINNNIGTYDFWIVRISETGSIVWEKNFGGTQIDEARGILAVNNNSFFVIGDTRSSDNQVSNNLGAADLWLININLDGNLIWEKTFGGSNFDAGKSISKGLNNNYILAGNSRSANGNLTQNKGQNDAWLLQVDGNGNIQKQISVGGSEIDSFSSAVQLDNNTIIAVGQSSSSDGDIPENKGFSDLLILQLQ
ncbi:hypothetical protein ACFSQP_05530 [Bizionia sediminis]|uniref:Bulb-type lectin domain-containing protein n=1 Tax=Bizionia sediminis TaxID=1737064 RepID=A0ABW5KQX8_9FLAO